MSGRGRWVWLGEGRGRRLTVLTLAMCEVHIQQLLHKIDTKQQTNTISGLHNTAVSND